MKKLVAGVFCCLLSANTHAASFGYAIPSSLLQESNVLHVEFDSNAPRSGLPSCATRTYIDLSTDAGKVRAEMVIAAFNQGREVFAVIADGLTSCSWSSSVPNRYIRVRRR
jgi:hypothetical protein